LQPPPPKKDDAKKISAFTEDDDDDDFDFDLDDSDDLKLKQEDHDDDAFRDLDAEMTMRMDEVALMVNHAEQLLKNVTDLEVCKKLVKECEEDEVLIKAIIRIVSASSGDSVLILFNLFSH
jgi:hypothetical protein